MGFWVCAGAPLQCSFGSIPSTLMVLPQNRCMTSMPFANIMDYKPFVNILPFGLCQSMANPTVAAASTVPPGVLKPMPCVPSTLAPWTPGSPTVLLSGAPTLNDSSQLMCMWAGVIKISAAGQINVMIK